MQVNDKSHPDHISRLGFIVWGNTEHIRKSKKDKESKANFDSCKDIGLNFFFLLISLVPLAVAFYFI